MAPLLLLLALLSLSLTLSLAAQLNPDASTLLQIKPILGTADNVILATWNSTSPLCSWRNLQWTYKNGPLLDCSSVAAANNLSLSRDPNIAVYEIDLAATGLNGTVPGQLSKLASLQKLVLNYNKLGGAIPFDLGNSASLAFLYLSHNQLTGNIPASLWNLCAQLVELDLDHNELNGTIPSPAGPNVQCGNLQTLDLDQNLLSGSIPSFLGTFSNLSKLNLSSNRLSGEIPTQLSQLHNLTSLDVSYNNLTGTIPSFGTNVTESAFTGNPYLCGPPLTQACGSAPTGLKHTGVSPKGVAALVIGVLAAAVISLALLVAIGHKHNWGRKDADAAASLRQELQEEDIGDGKLFRFEGGEHLTVEEVLNAPGEVLGKTKYGTVYKANLNNGGMIALRLLREDTISNKETFASAIHELGLIRHPNLVSVLAYYAGPKGEKLLVYDFLSRGSLSDLIHDKNPLKPPLGWGRRHKIVLGAARGLAYLHGLHSRMVHGNLKSKNIIVDENYEGHLADYGLDRLMNSAAQNEMFNISASQGYRAPELRKLSRANAKTDIYSFGIVLLEVLTGKKPKESEETSDKGEDLPTMVKIAVLEERTSELFDLEIMTSMRSPVDDGLLQTLQLAMGCCAPSPAVRPDIKEIIRQLEEIRPKIPTPLYTPTGMKSPRDFVS